MKQKNLKSENSEAEREGYSREMKIRKNTGITLVALVVTIVVLLILAGITINALLGQNSIFDLAREAAE